MSLLSGLTNVIRYQITKLSLPANKQKIKSLALSGAIYGGAGFVGFLYVTDWQIFMNKVPYYNKKFEDPKY